MTEDALSRGDLQAWYRNFAVHHVRDHSPRYVTLCEAVVESESVLAFLERLPAPRRQPNLLLATLQYLGETPGSRTDLEAVLERRHEDMATVMASRVTQTNEAGRCTAILAGLAGIEGPVALVDVGCSGGLLLHPDRYAYDFGGLSLLPDLPRGLVPPTLVCEVLGEVPLPSRLPEVVWRHGIDANPRNVTSDDDVAWLRAMIWPEQHARRAVFDRAVAVARAFPAPVTRGDAVEHLAEVAAEAPRDATLVIHHSAVTCYFPPALRATFEERVRGLDATWISSEGHGAVPAVARAWQGEIPEREFILARDGVPLALAAPHGQTLTALPSAMA